MGRLAALILGLFATGLLAVGLIWVLYTVATKALEARERYRAMRHGVTPEETPATGRWTGMIPVAQLDAAKWEEAEAAVLTRLGTAAEMLDQNGLNHLVLGEYRKRERA